MLKAHKMPKPIRDIAEQHHGTTFLKYFYHKAIKQAEEAGVEPDFTEEDFRYPGPESAIEGSRDRGHRRQRGGRGAPLRNPTMEQMESMIRKIIKEPSGRRPVQRMRPDAEGAGKSRRR